MQGEEIKTLRKGLGLTQDEMAARLGLSAKFIGMMERGDAPIEPRTALAYRKLTDRYAVVAAADGRWLTVRRTIAQSRREGGSFVHSFTALYGVFNRRDHAYRWAAALAGSEDPRWTKAIMADRKAEGLV